MGLGVTSCPSSPFTDVESEDLTKVPVQPHPSSKKQRSAKKHCHAGANKFCAKKRAMLMLCGML